MEKIKPNLDKCVIGFYDYSSNRWCYIRKGTRAPAFYNVIAKNALLVEANIVGNNISLVSEDGYGMTKLLLNMDNGINYYWDITNKPNSFGFLDIKGVTVNELYFKNLYKVTDRTDSILLYTYYEFLLLNMSYGNDDTNGIYLFPENFNPRVDVFPSVPNIDVKEKDKKITTFSIINMVFIFIAIILLGIFIIAFFFTIFTLST